MLSPKLEAARELIREKNYDAARAVLQTFNGDATAAKWLEELEKMGPISEPSVSAPAARVNGEAQPWEYMTLETKTAYGIQYRTNADKKPDWKDQPLYYVLNELGKEGWELVCQAGDNYVLKRPGIAKDNKKIARWDQ